MAITDKGDNTGNVFIDALAAYSFLDIGGDRNITYTLATGGNVSAHPWAPLTEKGQWQNALQQWVNVANITTQEVFYVGRGPAGGMGRYRSNDDCPRTGPQRSALPQAITLFRRAALAAPTGCTTGGTILRSFRQPE